MYIAEYTCNRDTVFDVIESNCHKMLTWKYFSCLHRTLSFNQFQYRSSATVYLMRVLGTIKKISTNWIVKVRLVFVSGSWIGQHLVYKAGRSSARWGRALHLAGFSRKQYCVKHGLVNQVTSGSIFFLRTKQRGLGFPSRASLDWASSDWLLWSPLPASLSSFFFSQKLLQNLVSSLSWLLRRLDL